MGTTEAMTEAMGALRDASGEFGHALTDEAQGALAAWAELTIQWRAAARLTSLRTPEAVLSELMVPALYALSLIEVTDDLHTVDFGCGNGCTSAALAAVTGCGHWYLVDRDEKKVVFCRYAQQRCRIAGIEVKAAEELRRQGMAAGVVLARGVPREGPALGEAAALLGGGGVLLRWVAGDSAPSTGRTVRCGERNLWVVAQGRECFT